MFGAEKAKLPLSILFCNGKREDAVYKRWLLMDLFFGKVRADMQLIG
jgi:hypothetical protein